MNRTTRILTLFSAATAMYTAVEFWKFHREQAAIRKQIRDDVPLEIDAIAQAAKKVIADIHAGKYSGRNDPFAAMHNDLDFYTITSRPER